MVKSQTKSKKILVKEFHNITHGTYFYNFNTTLRKDDCPKGKQFTKIRTYRQTHTNIYIYVCVCEWKGVCVCELRFFIISLQSAGTVKFTFLEYRNLVSSSGNLFASQNPREFYESHFLEEILVCAYIIYQSCQISFSYTIPSWSTFPPNHAFSCILFFYQFTAFAHVMNCLFNIVT